MGFIPNLDLILTKTGNMLFVNVFIKAKIVQILSLSFLIFFKILIF